MPQASLPTLRTTRSPMRRLPRAIPPTPWTIWLGFISTGLLFRLGHGLPAATRLKRDGDRSDLDREPVPGGLHVKVAQPSQNVIPHVCQHESLAPKLGPLFDDRLVVQVARSALIEEVALT